MFISPRSRVLVTTPPSFAQAVAESPSVAGMIALGSFHADLSFVVSVNRCR